MDDDACVMTETERNRAAARIIRKAIQESGKGITKWAEDIGHSQQRVSAYLNGLARGTRASARPDLLRAIADAVPEVAELIGMAPKVEVGNEEPWDLFDTVVRYNRDVDPGRWLPDTIVAFRATTGYRASHDTVAKIEKALDTLDKVFREMRADPGKARRDTKDAVKRGGAAKSRVRRSS